MHDRALFTTGVIGGALAAICRATPLLAIVFGVSGGVLRGVSPKKSLVKIGDPSHTRRFASDRGEFSPNGSQSGYSARVV